MRSKSYTIINLLGLAFSLACCIVLMRYIHRELTVDSHCIDPQHIIIPLRDIDGNIHPGSLEQGWSDTDSTYIPENKIVEQCRLQAHIIRKTKCFDFWERNVLFPKTKRSFFRTPTPSTLPFSA